MPCAARLILVQKNGSGSRRSRFGQGEPRSGGERIGRVPGGPLFPRNHAAAATDEKLFQPRDRGRTAVAMQLDHLVRDAAENDLFIAQAADHNLPQRQIGQQPAGEQPADQFQAGRAFNPQTGHRAAAGRSEDGQVWGGFGSFHETFSFPRSAWERPEWPLRGLVGVAKVTCDMAAERP